MNDDDLAFFKIMLVMFFVIFILCSIGYYDEVPNMWMSFIK